MTTTRKVRRRAATGQLARYLGAPYVRMIIPNAEEGGYLAEVLELPGCITDGDTLEEAYRNLEDAMAGWIEASLENGRPIPEAVGDKEYSGHFPLRMSTELHRAAALRAMQEGVSLNQWITGAIAEKVAKEDLAEELAEKIAPKVAERIRFTAFGAFGMQFGTGETLAETTEAKVEPSWPDSTMILPDTALASLPPGLLRRIRIMKRAEEVKQNA
jgi:antitoxin HicB